jgi:hypothetical protein
MSPDKENLLVRFRNCHLLRCLIAKPRANKSGHRIVPAVYMSRTGSHSSVQNTTILISLQENSVPRSTAKLHGYLLMIYFIFKINFVYYLGLSQNLYHRKCSFLPPISINIRRTGTVFTDTTGETKTKDIASLKLMREVIH